MTHVSFSSLSFATSASEMPVFPLVGSSSSWPGRRSACSTIASATRSLIDPVGFWPSSFAYRRTPSGAIRGSSTSGVFPIRSRSELATTGHRRQEDHRRARGDRCLETVVGADVLTFDVDVHEGLEVAVVDALAERWEPRGQVLQQLADGAAGGGHLALAARRVA